MKKNVKIAIFVFLIIGLLCTIVDAADGTVCSDKLHVTISNIDDKISKIELLTVRDCIPSEIFEYEIVKPYGYYNDDDHFKKVFIWDKNEIVKDEKNHRTEYYKGKMVYKLKKGIKLYQITDYDKSKYILENTVLDGGLFTIISSDGRTYKVYYDSNENPFTLYKIESTNEIENFKIKHGKFELLIDDLIKNGKQRKDKKGTYVPYMYLRFYKDNMEYKDIAIGNNSIMKSGDDILSNISKVSKKIDYQTGKLLSVKGNTKRDYVVLVIKIAFVGLIAIFVIIVILSVVRRIRKKRN